MAKCGTGGTCVDTAGAYSCDCEEGYMEDGGYPFTTCITINEYESGSGNQILDLFTKPIAEWSMC